jgi:hypothetical protein
MMAFKIAVGTDVDVNPKGIRSEVTTPTFTNYSNVPKTMDSRKSFCYT